MCAAFLYDTICTTDKPQAYVLVINEEYTGTGMVQLGCKSLESSVSILPQNEFPGRRTLFLIQDFESVATTKGSVIISQDMCDVNTFNLKFTDFNGFVLFFRKPGKLCPLHLSFQCDIRNWGPEILVSHQHPFVGPFYGEMYDSCSTASLWVVSPYTNQGLIRFTTRNSKLEFGYIMPYRNFYSRSGDQVEDSSDKVIFSMKDDMTGTLNLNSFAGLLVFWIDYNESPPKINCMSFSFTIEHLQPYEEEGNNNNNLNGTNSVKDQNTNPQQTVEPVLRSPQISTKNENSETESSPEIDLENQTQEMDKIVDNGTQTSSLVKETIIFQNERLSRKERRGRKSLGPATLVLDLHKSRSKIPRSVVCEDKQIREFLSRGDNMKKYGQIEYTNLRQILRDAKKYTRKNSE